jgi:multimeric flavodoxin WrbA
MARKRRSKTPEVRKGMPSVALSKEEVERRFRRRFADPAFAQHDDALSELLDVEQEVHAEDRKYAQTRPAGRGFADPEFPLSLDWLGSRRRVLEAQRRWKRKTGPARILVVNGSPRSDHTCPGEISKSWRLADLACRAIRAHRGFEADLLDLSRLTSEYGLKIHPCKACVATAMPLCHWPCSCYPNHALGQSPDWMSDIYPLWVAAHGVLIVTPVHWYQAPSVLKLMIDRLVCADGGNPDPTTTGGKDPAKAKALELAGWHYPRHLAGRAYAVVVHGDAAGVENLTRNLSDWLTDMKLVKAGLSAELGRYVGYYAPYATSHDALDADEGFQREVKGAVAGLVETVRRLRRGECAPPDPENPRPK